MMLLWPGAGGYGVEQDDTRAMDYLQTAHDSGHWRAPYQVAPAMCCSCDPGADWHLEVCRRCLAMSAPPAGLFAVDCHASLCWAGTRCLLSC